MKTRHPKIRIGFAGFGTVGQGVWKHLKRDRKRLEKRLGVRLELAAASVRDLDRPRSVKIPEDRLTTDYLAIARDPDLQIVCELMGGTTAARKFTLEALRTGKIVVSANKALLCEYGEEIFTTAREHGGHFFFEASTAGGIPIIKALREGLVANRFSLIYGILNGTCNYILSRMENEGLSFPDLLQQARDLGYVEADEALDIDGLDTAHKAAILSYLAHGRWVSLKEMLIEGIREITQEDIQQARELGYRIKLLAVITRNLKNGKLFVRVHPTLVPQNLVMAGLAAAYNGVCVQGDVVGTTFYIGHGAGQDATASAVISDIADACLLLKGSVHPLLPDETGPLHEEYSPPCDLASLEEVQSRYYLRLRVKDAPGVLSNIAGILAAQGISLATVRQREIPDTKQASLILITHMSNEKAIAETLQLLRKTKEVLHKPYLLRIADFEE